MPENGSDSALRAAETPLLELRDICKSFPGVVANEDISLTVAPGEIHALLGENGAGKSTLVKIIYGALRPDSGGIRWRGEAVAIAGPAAARRLGIGMVFQHFSLFDSLTVLENIALAVDDYDDMAALRAKVERVAESYGLPLALDRHVHDLSVGERQRIEIVRCLLQDPKLLILDEPTSVLTPQEAEALFEILRRLAAEGHAILYISHKLAEVQALCHRATILRLGRLVAQCEPARESTGSLAEMMIGQKAAALSRGARGTFDALGPVRLRLADLNLTSPNEHGTDLKGVSLNVHAGEIVGLAGIAGNGQNELMQALTGEEVLPASPEAIRIDDSAVAHLGPAARRALGAVFVPEERHGHGAVTEMNLAENSFLTAGRRLGLVWKGLVRGKRSRAFAERVMGEFDVRAPGSQTQAATLSGGNLQKFIVGREMLQQPNLLVIAQPTWGVDAGAAATIHQALIDLANRGAAVLVISQDLDEIFAVCDRVAVISEGRLSEAGAIESVSIEAIGLLMGGVRDQPTDGAAA